MAEPSTFEDRPEIVAEIERRHSQLNQRLFNIYHSYRLFVGVALLVISAQSVFNTRLGSLNFELFQAGALAYCIVGLVVLVATRIRAGQYFQARTVALAFACIDISWLTWLMYLSGGIASGLGALVLVAVAAGAILLEGRRSAFIAAVATIALLYEEFYLGLTTSNQGDVFQAGVFGGLYFTVSLVIQRFSSRVRNNDILTLSQEVELADLEKLNRQIIQRMRTGIIVVNADNQVRLHNQSARSLIGVRPGDELTQLPPTLLSKLEAWRADTTLRNDPFRAAEYGSEIRANFSAIRAQASTGDVTIFLEDTSEVQQQAQQLKLAKLGTLSASIAHEVRNPLGAISHAAQLLIESEELSEADQRLANIITHHCERMNGVVENVLEMSRRREPQPRQMDLCDYVQDFVNEASFIDAEIEVELEDEEILLRFDPSHLTQTLTNLVDNGLRYSEENGQGRRVKLVAGIEQSSERPFLNVIDFGTGVDDEQIPKLFQPFSTTAVGGTGLGLYICKELCDTNRAQLSYLRSDTVGSCFRILFAHPDRISR
ncbi:MAG: HAMP domain-containing sensor histidine kinase [Pseudomonadales bacterium]